MEAYLKKLIEEILHKNNETFLNILKDMRKQSKVKEVTIVHEGERYVSRSTAAFLLDVSESWIDKKVLEGRLEKKYLDGYKTPRYLESEILSLVTSDPNEPETRQPKRIRKKKARIAEKS